MNNYEWAMLMSETYEKQKDYEMAKYYHQMAQYFKEKEIYLDNGKEVKA